MNVEQVCRRLDNRMYHLLMFEGQPVKLRSGTSACRQLYMKWRGDADYETFKKNLRFHFESGWLMVTVKQDYTPMVAGVGVGVGLGIGYGLYSRHKNSKPEIQVPRREAILVAPARSNKSIADRVHAGGDVFPDLGVVQRDLIDKQNNEEVKQERVEYVPTVCANISNWQDVEVGTRPALFAHDVSSCYFHASMLMLFQMRSWLDSKITGDVEELLRDIKRLLEAMSTNDRLQTDVFQPTYALVQSTLEKNGIPNRQQDANEFLVYLIARIADKEDIQFKTHSHINYPRAGPIPIEKLVCGGIPISKHNVDVFARYWDKLIEDQQKLDVYTLKDNIIIPKDLLRAKEIPRNLQECTLARGGPSSFDDVDFEVDDSSRDEKTEPDTIMKVVLQPGIEDMTNVCDLVQNQFNGEKINVVAKNPGPGRTLFDVKAKQTTTFVPLSHNQFYIVHLQYRPNEISGKKFTYGHQVTFQSLMYELTCVIFRTGCSANSGHYTAALNIGANWILYDDLAQTRKFIPDGNLSRVPGTPFMMLFKRLQPKGNEFAAIHAHE